MLSLVPISHLPSYLLDFVKQEVGELQETKPQQVYTTIETLLPNNKKGEVKLRFAEL